MHPGLMNRRQFIKKASGILVGALVGAHSRTSPPAPSLSFLFRPSRVYASTPELRLLTYNHFVPASNEKLKEQAARFAGEQGIVVRVDTLDAPQMPAKWAAEIQAQAGHDVVWLPVATPWLYAEHLMDVSDIAEKIEGDHGGWYPFARDNDFVKGSWKAVPWFWESFVGLYREDLFEQAGLSVPQTWEDVLNAGRVLKKQGHPVGIPVSPCTNAYTTFWSILWGFGGKVLEADGKTLALSSPETEAALEYYKNLYQDAMEPEVLNWDDAGNNKYLLSGKGCWIHNAISPYITAVEKKMPLADKMGVHLSPAGPAGRHIGVYAHALGIWKFSKNQELAKSFISYLFQPENYTEWILASGGYNTSPLRGYENLSIWVDHPKFKILPQQAQFAHADGWPVTNGYIQRIDDLFILPNMAAKVVTGTSVKAAIAWAEGEIKKILEA